MKLAQSFTYFALSSELQNEDAETPGSHGAHLPARPNTAVDARDYRA